MAEKEGKSSGLPGGTLLLCVCKGALAAFAVSLVGVFLFALVLGWFRVPESAIGVVNQTLRIVSVIAGAYTALRGAPQRGWLKGLLSGLLYAALTYTVFSFIDGSWYFGLPLLYDALTAAGAGAAAGILLVNLRKK